MSNFFHIAMYCMHEACFVPQRKIKGAVLTLVIPEILVVVS